jgi:DNA-binding transcriptional MocR family regulator
VAQVQSRALGESISFTRGDVFYVDHAGERELRLCFSSIPVARADELARRLLKTIAAVRRDAAPPPQLVAIS